MYYIGITEHEIGFKGDSESLLSLKEVGHHCISLWEG